MKYVQKPYWKEHLCTLQVFLRALVSQPVCTHAAKREHWSWPSHLI